MEIEGRADVQAAGFDPALAEALHELLRRPTEEVRMPLLAVERAGLQPEARRDGGRVLRRSDVAVVHHRTEHLVPARERVVRMTNRVVDGRRLRQAGEQRGLC